MTKQIFAYTEPTYDIDKYVKFLQAFEAEGGFNITIRNEKAQIETIFIPEPVAKQMAQAFLKSLYEIRDEV